MENLLDIRSPILIDESVAHWEIHSHQPFASSTYNNSDEIHIVIQHQDQCVLPSRSSIRIVGKLTQSNGEKLKEGISLVNNPIAHLFSEIRYLLNAIEIDKCKNLGITSLMKGYASLSPSQLKFLEISGWNSNSLIDDNGNFEILIPLSMVLGFAEDYQKIIVNAKHELILTRSNTDNNAIIQTQNSVTAKDTFKFTLTKIEWLVPTIILSNIKKANLLKFIEKDPALTVSFRSWELYEYPQLPQTSKHVWTVKTSSQLEKPRYVILAFQTARNNELQANVSEFDHCDIRNVKLFLNSQYYPYGDLNLDMNNNHFVLLYEMYANFQASFYGKNIEPILNLTSFKNVAPLIVFDCSKQNEILKSAPVDVRLEFESRRDFPAKTTALCLIIHDRIIQYKPISGDVKKMM